MTTIQVKSIPTDCIAHETSVDFNGEICSKPVSLMQYDNNMPILAIHLYLNGLPYSLPNDVYGNIRLKKKDGTFVYNPVYGCDSTRQIIYVVVTAQITYCYGDVFPTLEIATSPDIHVPDSSAKYSCTGYLHLKINQNPINEHDESSTSEYETIIQAAAVAEEVLEAEQEVLDARNIAVDAKNIAVDAKDEAVEAAADATAAKDEANSAMIEATDYAQSASISAGIADGAKEYVKSSADTIMQLPRQVFRGKRLGNTITNEQLTAIKNGNFSGLFIGDYWDTRTDPDTQDPSAYARYTIVDFDYFYNSGYQTESSQLPFGQIDEHHVVVMAEFPSSYGCSSYMNTSNTTQNGYAGCYLRNNYLLKNKLAYNKIVTDIRNMSSNAKIIEYNDYLTTGYSVTNNGSVMISGLAWKPCICELFSEIMVYGTMITSLRLSDMAPYVSESDDRFRVDKTQMALFRLVPATINTFWYRESFVGIEHTQTYWLRDMVNAERFSDVHAMGRANSHKARYADQGDASFAIRCFFLLTKS